MKQTIISTVNLTKHYGKNRGITDLNLNVTEGDFFGFIGPNGAGKSTTIRLLLGLISPSGGSVNLFGRDIQTAKQEILSDIGYLPSETNFYSRLRVRDILQLSARLRQQSHHIKANYPKRCRTAVSSASFLEACHQTAMQLCERLALDPSRNIDELSLGNRKKVGIVCALQHHPRLYILDEPTSGLDPLIQREFYNILKERNQEGATIFLSSHILSEIQRYCRHAAIIREGRLLVTNSVEKLGHTDAKRVTLHGVSKVPVLDGIRLEPAVTEGSRTSRQDRAASVEGTSSVSFLYSGSPQKLLEALAPLPLTDLTITEPDLEEIFLHYYNEQP